MPEQRERGVLGVNESDQFLPASRIIWKWAFIKRLEAGCPLMIDISRKGNAFLHGTKPTG